MSITCKVHPGMMRFMTEAQMDLVSGNTSPVDTFKCALMGTGFSFDPTSSNYDSYLDAAISSAEISTAGGYSTGGVTLTNVYTSDSFATGIMTFSCDPIDFAAVGTDMDGAVAAVFYDDTITEKPVLCCIEFGATYTTAAGTTFRIGLTNGLFKFTCNPT